jgi:hypothetical protein
MNNFSSINKTTMPTKTKLIKTFEEAIKKLGLPDGILPNVSQFPIDQQKALTAHAKLLVIVQALNDGWKPDWNSDDELKYYPWWDMEKTESNPSGFGLNYVYCESSISIVGSRLCFRTRALAEHAAKYFYDLYKESLTF